MTTPILKTPVVSGAQVQPEPPASPSSSGLSRDAVLEILYNAAEANGVDPRVAVTLAGIESNYNPKAVSGAGAQGLLQLMPGTAKELGVTDPFDPVQNANAGMRYYKMQLDKYKDPVLAAAAYNAGPGNVDKYGGVPPFRETRGYVEKFAKAMGTFDGKLQVGPDGKPDTGIDFSQFLGEASKPQAPQVDVDPMQFLLPDAPKRGVADKFSEIANSIAMIGGTAANAIGAFKGNDGVGNGSIALARTFLADASKTKDEAERSKRLNALISNTSLPKAARNYVGLVANGIPESMAAKLTESPDGMEKMLKALNIARSYQAYQADTPEGQAAADQRSLGKFSQEEAIRASFREKTVDKPPAKIQEIEHSAKRITELSNKENRTPEEEKALKGFQAYYKSLTKEGVNETTAAYMRERLVKPGGVVDNYNTAASAYDRLERFEKILEGIPDGRIQGNIATYLQKVRGDAAVAEYNTLKTLIGADVVRKVLREVGNLNEEEQKRSLSTIDVAGKTLGERKAQLQVVKNALKKSMLNSYGAVNYMADTLDDPELVGTLKKSGSLLKTPEEYFGSPEQAKSEPLAPVENELLNKFGGRVR